MSSPPVSGVRLGVDVGSVRVGVALSDSAGVLATPLATLARDRRGGTDLDALAALVDKHAAVEVVVGLPRGLSGREGTAAELARSYAEALSTRVAVPVRLIDERLTTVVAERGLRDKGVAGRSRRASIDAAAATVILQSALDTDRGRPLRGGVPGCEQP